MVMNNVFNVDSRCVELCGEISKTLLVINLDVDMLCTF